MTPPAVPRSSRLKLDARAALLEAGTDLFGRHGFDVVTTRALAQKAGVNLSAIKYYFGNKERYYRAVLKSLMKELEDSLETPLAVLRAAIAESSGDAVRLRKAVDTFVDFWCHSILLDPRTQRRMPFITWELLRPTKNFELVYNSFFRRLHEVIGELLVATPSSSKDKATLKVQAQAVLNQLHGFVIMETVLWREMKWKAYDKEKVAQLLPSLQQTFAQSLGLSQSASPS